MKDVIPQIGITLPRHDAWTKVIGRENYAADYYGSGFLWAGVKRSECPHARLIKLDTEDARLVPGVMAVLTHLDVPGPNRHGIVLPDQPVLVADKVRRYGDALALVLAENRPALEKALSLIKTELEPWPAVFDPESALSEGAPLVHEDKPGNLLAEVLVEKGDGAAGIEKSALVVEGRFETPRQEHAFLETQAGWACLDLDGRVVITASTQSPYRDRMEVASALGLEPDRVRVRAPYLGGGFGGKDGCNVQCLLALAALEAGGRPVKMHWSREESFLAGVKRLPARLHYRIGAAADGTLLALDCRIIMDAGAYDHLAGEILALAVEHAGGAYRWPDVRLHGRCAYTNNPPGGPFRGFGAPQVTAALEQMMDLLAARLDLDPLDLRLKNVIRRGEKNAIGVTLSGSAGAWECLQKIAGHSIWRNRKSWQEEAPPFQRRGVGLACLMHGAGYGPAVPDYANAKIELTASGRFKVDAAVADMGQGNAATYLQIAGHILNQRLEDLDLALPDTEQTLPSCSSTASRTTYTYGQAMIRAAEKMKDRLLAKAADLMLSAAAEEFALAPGLVRHLPSAREIPLARLAGTMAPAERVQTGYWRAPVVREAIKTGIMTAYGLPHLVFSFAAHAAAVEVDELTGRVAVKNYLAVTDAGRVLNPQVYEQQVQGGVAQGLGYALTEDYQVQEGRGLTPDLATYIVPTALDVPDLETMPVETHEPTGPFGQKGIGEIPINGPLPAVANAVTDAIGARIYRSPLTPVRVRRALETADKRKAE
ncbi:MAG: xanthine dehydrogenase family protein molybdopterin-binding subunit [Thermodesulfobacteriota bacterium]